ncbi:SMI1/KNR4 family protein [uncultured Arcticibacterium sp.]|uniref:SMI1/KNR4 family protein n=1 Tax=uncultured Arcticibacterium sp. TaxID=2173042 RepID=UPI0030FC2FF7
MRFEDFLDFHKINSEGNPLFGIYFEQVELNDDSFQKIEGILGFQFPNHFKQFWLYFKAKYFGGLVLLPVETNQKGSILQVLKKIDFFLPRYIPFCDDQTGGHYCFETNGNIVFLDEVGNLEVTEYLDFLDFVIKNAY